MFGPILAITAVIWSLGSLLLQAVADGWNGWPISRPPENLPADRLPHAWRHRAPILGGCVLVVLAGLITLGVLSRRGAQSVALASPATVFSPVPTSQPSSPPVDYREGLRTTLQELNRGTDAATSNATLSAAFGTAAHTLGVLTAPPPAEAAHRRLVDALQGASWCIDQADNACLEQQVHAASEALHALDRLGHVTWTLPNSPSGAARTPHHSQSAPSWSKPAPPAPTAPRLHSLTATWFSVSYPAGWRVEDMEVSKVSYLDTTIRDPKNPHALIRIDTTPDYSGSPATGADAVRASVSKEPGYKELRFDTVSFARTTDAVWWEWTTIENGVRLHKVDVFFVHAGAGYAILTQAPVALWARLAPTLNQVRGSLVTGQEPRGDAENLRISPEDRHALRETFLAAHSRYSASEIGEALPGSVYYGRSRGTDYAFATFSLPEGRTTRQPEVFRRDADGDWEDLGNDGGRVCTRKVPAALIHEWHLIPQGSC